jgi:drug/metabolite transporter (DMT)-like permease
MIQRIQSIWLLVSALCAASSYKFPFYSGNMLNPDGTQSFEKLDAGSNFILLITTAVLGAGCFYIIFLYKNREQQFWLTLAALGLSVINLFIYFNETQKYTSGNMALGSVLSIGTPIFLLLAAMGIRKDQKLVKSVDRLR